MKLLVIIGDLVICNILFFLFGQCESPIPSTELLRSHILVTAIYFSCAFTSGVVLYYRRVRRYQIYLKVLRNVLLFAFVGTPLLVLGKFFLPHVVPYILFLASSFILVSAYRITLREIILHYRLSEKRMKNIVFVGNADELVELYKEFANNRTLGYRVCGFFDDVGENNYPNDCQCLGQSTETVAYLKHHPEVHECYCCMSSNRKDELLDIIHYCENNLIRFYCVPIVRSYLRHRMYCHLLGNVPYLSLHEEPLNFVGNQFLKRAFDILFSVLFLCTLFPFIFIFVAIMTKATMPGPIFFRQKRSGLNGEEFYCLKFRSMRVNDDADILQATKEDPRKTKFGNIMRKTNIDELPQFINVLMGDMSIVGPRPHMIKHTEEYSRIIDKYMIRHYVKPGITGLSQVTGFRGETKELFQMEGRIQGDIWYIEHWSFGLDLYIIYKTVANVFRGNINAY